MPSDKPVATPFNKPPAEPTFDDVPLTPIEAKTAVQRLTGELASATAEQVPGLLLRIQRARVVWLLLAETDAGAADPQTLKELNSLNKMLTGKDLGGDEPEGDKERLARTAEMLTARGVSAEGVPQILRVLESVMSDGIRTRPAEPN